MHCFLPDFFQKIIQLLLSRGNTFDHGRVAHNCSILKFAIMSSFSNFDAIVNDRAFANLVNGPLALGLAIMEEKGLGEDEKLPVLSGTSQYSYGQYPNVIYFYVLYFYEG